MTERIPNILFNTTRMWNCGDDFIAFGVRNLLNKIYSIYNPLVYNRNPDLHFPAQMAGLVKMDFPEFDEPKQINLSPIVSDLCFKYDNSVRPGHKLSMVDLCIYSGTPEWFGVQCAPLVELLRKSSVKILFLGIGGFDFRQEMTYEKLPESDREVLERAALITVRDSQVEKLLAPLKPHRLPCPALFSAPHNRKRSKITKIALSCQAVKSMQPPMIPESFNYCRKLFEKLSKHVQCEIVCHYIDEVLQFERYFDMPVRYSYDPADYIKIYDEFDLTVNTRVHGAGLCASLGIPAFVIKHSARSETAEGFLAESIVPDESLIDETVERILSFDVEARSSKLLAHKEKYFNHYIQLLTEVL